MHHLARLEHLVVHDSRRRARSERQVIGWVTGCHPKACSCRVGCLMVLVPTADAHGAASGIAAGQVVE